MIGTIGNPALVDMNRVFSIKNVALLKEISDISMKYVYYYTFFYQKYFRKEAKGGKSKICFFEENKGIIFYFTTY